jgi:SAM-dependent methyltransferase
MKPIPLSVLATAQNFDETAYLRANPDVRRVVEAGSITALAHFHQYGKSERRQQRFKVDPKVRKRKMDRLLPFLRLDMEHTWENGKVDFLTEALRKEAHIADTDNVSSHGYDPNVEAIIASHCDGLILDCGAGRRDSYYENVVNFEIVDFDSTDVLGVGEQLPFRDNTFDAIISVAVLEHVRNPFRCADEIARALKPGGELYCCLPFLQPYHGYPHHYFNATAQGHRSLFEDKLNIMSVEVLAATHPIWTISWMLNSWSEGLAADLRSEFHGLTVLDLMQAPTKLVNEPFCSGLPMDKQLELACATLLRARKPLSALPTANGRRSE